MEWEFTLPQIWAIILPDLSPDKMSLGNLLYQGICHSDSKKQCWHLSFALICTSKVTGPYTFVYTVTRNTVTRKVFFSTEPEFLTDWDFRLIVLLHQETAFLMKECTSQVLIMGTKRCLSSFVWGRNVLWQELPIWSNSKQTYNNLP